MIFRVIFLAACLALASGEANQQPDQNEYYNSPSYQSQGLQGQQYYSYYPQSQSPYNYPSQYQGPYNYPSQYQGPYNYPSQYQGPYNYPWQNQGSYNYPWQNQGPYNYPWQNQGLNGRFRQFQESNPNDAFRQYEVIALINNENQALGFVYAINSDAVDKENFIPVRDNNGNLVAYYSWRQYSPVQEPLNENVILQLQQLGFNYNQQNKEGNGVLVARNPYVFYLSQNGILSPRILENSGYFQRQQAGYPYYGPYSQQYGQQYYGPYYQQYQGPYDQFRYPGPYSQQFQGPYARYPFNYYQYASA